MLTPHAPDLQIPAAPPAFTARIYAALGGRDGCSRAVLMIEGGCAEQVAGDEHCAKQGEEPALLEIAHKCSSTSPAQLPAWGLPSSVFSCVKLGAP